METTRLFALHGQATGTLKITISQKGTRVWVMLRKTTLPPSSVYIIDALGKARKLILVNNQAFLQDERLNANAVLLSACVNGGERFIAEGMLSGAPISFENVKRDIRILVSREAEKKDKLAERIRKDDQTIANDVRLSDADEDIENSAAQKEESKPDTYGKEPRQTMLIPASRVREKENGSYYSKEKDKSKAENSRAQNSVQGSDALKDILAQAAILFPGDEKVIPMPQKVKAAEIDAMSSSVQLQNKRCDTADGADKTGGMILPHAVRTVVENPFPAAFPSYRFTRVEYSGTRRYYLEGVAMKNGARYIVHALPDSVAVDLPMRFKRHMMDMIGVDGIRYWIKMSSMRR